jgi:hypothetical protein
VVFFVGYGRRERQRIASVDDYSFFNPRPVSLTRLGYNSLDRQRFVIS